MFVRARRLLAASLGTMLGAGLVGVIASPAQAYQQWDVSKSGWAYTDSHLPNQSNVNPSGDAPIGAWADAGGNEHKSRSYFTFDISRFRGAVIHKADLVIAAPLVSSSTYPANEWADGVGGAG